jgi:L-seryl-tRNA(Ser) seleniumtransferase
VRASFESGASVVSFSGDKLLGGPQAGIIAGKRELVERIRRNPLFRALRVDKLTIAALEATLNAYLRGPDASGLEEIPALRMIRLSAEEIGRRAEALVVRLRAQLPAGEVEIEIRDAASVIGGGSTPDQQLPTRVIAIASVRYSAAQLEERLRLGVPSGHDFSRAVAAAPKETALAAEGQIPSVIGRVEDDRLLLDLRTVFPEQDAAVAAAVVAALA